MPPDWGELERQVTIVRVFNYEQVETIQFGMSQNKPTNKRCCCGSLSEHDVGAIRVQIRPPEAFLSGKLVIGAVIFLLFSET